MQDDGDIGAMWREHKAERAIKRAKNRDDSVRMLREAGIVFESNNGGAHVVINHDRRLIDFWPGTGLWIVRGADKRRRGVALLLKFLGVQSAAPPKPVDTP